MVVPITFVKASGSFRASCQKFNAIATTTTTCSDMGRVRKVNVEPLPTWSSPLLVSKAVIRLIVSLSNNPVHNLGGIVEPSGASSRFLRGEDVKYRVISVCKGCVFNYDVSLVKLVHKYGLNNGNLRSRIRIMLMRSSKIRETRGSLQTKSVAHSPHAEAARLTRAAMRHEVPGLVTKPVNFSLKGGVNIFKAPENVIHRSMFSEGLQNPYMLFKFFFPEVFQLVDYDATVCNLSLRAAFGHLVRRGTPLELESEAGLCIHYRNLAHSAVGSFDELLKIVRDKTAMHTPYRVVPFSEDNPRGSVRLRSGFTNYLSFNDPRAALMLYPGHYDLLKVQMSSHPSYKECHQAFVAGLPSQKRRSVPSTTR